MKLKMIDAFTGEKNNLLEEIEQNKESVYADFFDPAYSGIIEKFFNLYDLDESYLFELIDLNAFGKSISNECSVEINNGLVTLTDEYSVSYSFHSSANSESEFTDADYRNIANEYIAFHSLDNDPELIYGSSAGYYVIGVMVEQFGIEFNDDGSYFYNEPDEEMIQEFYEILE